MVQQHMPHTLKETLEDSFQKNFKCDRKEQYRVQLPNEKVL
jgi:hypothetical protein